jgi:sporulation protein YlmC with PRC-barrel domain
MTTFDIGHRLLDRRVVDRHGRVLGKVDDLELDTDDSGRLHVSAVLMGPEALGRRLGGRLGAFVSSFGRLRADDGAPPRIAWVHVVEVAEEVRTDLDGDDLEFPRSERWLREHMVEPLPGSSRSSGEGPEGDTAGEGAS